LLEGQHEEGGLHFIPLIRLLIKNLEKAASLQRHQINVSQIEPLAIPPNPFNARYQDTKALKFDHALPVQWHLG
jgi:3,4-dihydroxy 2-butanone 4-phosphate synthase / GTP cyclohydrolase II